MDAIVRYIAIYSTVPSFVYAAYRWPYFKLAAPDALKWVVVLRFVGEMVGLLSLNLLPNNLPVFGVYALVECLVMVNLFVAFNGQTYRKLLFIVAASIGLYLLFQLAIKPTVYPTTARLIQVVFIAALLGWHIVRSVFVAKRLHLHEVFALVGLFLFYFTSILNVYGFHQYTQPFIKVIYIQHYVFSAGANLLLLFALYHYYQYYAQQH
ncbi:MAG: hypothetical protein EAY81_02540 [Bacteroidetes bacterium]|nr:MAG: hypothetical protein EAY81_02540 [Bacteroidota bacterium]